MRTSLLAGSFVVALIAGANLPSASKANVISNELTAERDQAAEQQLEELEQAINRRLQSGDSAGPLGMVATDFIGMDAGVWEGKVQWVPQDKKALAEDLESSVSNLASVTVHDLDARVHGHTGIVRGGALFRMKNGAVFQTHFLDTWERRSDRWILVASSTSSQRAH